jgi:acyl carrier protein
MHRSDLTEGALQDWCCQYLGQLLRRTPESIDRSAPFDSLGIDSAESVFLVSALEEWSKVQLSPETAIEHPNVIALSRFVFRMSTEGGGANPARS